MKYGVIKIYGSIGDCREVLGPDIPAVNLLDVIAQVKAAGEVDQYNILIKSMGGIVDVGHQIANFLKGLKKPVFTIIDSQCSSIATVVALAADTDKRFIIAGSKGMIHNPWGAPSGDADYLTQYAESLKEAEQEMIEFYSECTGIPESGIEPMMKAETVFSAEDWVKFGFAARVITQEEANALGLVDSPALNVKIFAIYKTNKNETMTGKNTKAGKILAKILAAISSEESAKALDAKTADGKAVVITTESDTMAVGDAVTLDGAAAPSADITLEDQTIIKTDADSKIAEIVPFQASAPATETATEKALREENISLKAQIKALSDEKEETEVVLDAISEKVDKMEVAMNLLKKEKGSTHEPEGQRTPFRAVGKTHEDDKAVSEAVQRMKDRNKTRRGIK